MGSIRNRLRQRRTGAAVGAVCALVLSVVVSGARAGEDGADRAPADLQVDITRTSQAEILGKGAIRVEVTPPIAPGDVDLRASTATANGPAPVSDGRSARVKTAEPRRVRLALNRRGVRRIGRCVAQEIRVRAKGDFVGGVQLRGRGTADLVLDLPECDDDGSLRDFELDPDDDRAHTNETPRDFDATGIGQAGVLVALYACDDVTDEGGELRFASAAGKAAQNPSGAGITHLNGQAVAGSPQTAGPAEAQNGKVEFTISGSDGCAAAIVFEDANSDGKLDVGGDGVPTERYGGGSRTTFEPQGVEFMNGERCDPTDPSVCLYPFPNDHFTVADASTDTGRRIAFAGESMPQNRFGLPIDATDHNRADGYSPGAMLITRVPGLDDPQAFENTGSVPITDFDRYADADAPVVVIDAATGERHPIFTELDANPADPADVTLIIRPTVNFEEGHRYVVALRNLRNAANEPIPAGRAFQLYRDRIATSDPLVEQRREEFEQVFAELEAGGIPRENLYLAWDFTIASERSLSERILSIRDRAFAELGDSDLTDLEPDGAAPATAITSVTDYLPCGDDGCQEGLQIPDIPVIGPFLDPVDGIVQNYIGPAFGMAPEDDRIAREVNGVISVPCFLDEPGCPPGARFNLGEDGLPQESPVPHLANFKCLIPRATIDDGLDPSRPSLYGHGLLGSHTEVEAGNVKAMANEHNVTFCATDWAGFATEDIPTVLLNLQDLSNFNRLVDRMQQGYLNFLFLGRAMIHPEGLSSHPAFQVGGEPAVDTTRLFYDGNSQGGIMGGALTAVAPDFERAVLGVPAMNYSTLLRRSSDFAPYAEGNFNDPPGDTEAGLYDNYPDELERPLILALMQMLWDRGEANGYAHHMTSDPPPNTPPHQVLMHVAFGDHQVTNLAADVQARTIGAYTNSPSLDPGRIPAGDPLWDVPAIPSYPFDGSGIIYFDSGPPREGDQGVVNPPLTNTPPGNPEHGRDPHGDPRNDPQGRVQKSAFLRVDGRVIYVCGGDPCYAHGWTGP